ncbi:Methionine--tRNA ligase, chloroplastic/mitochondrial [Stylosanthes scabra]|uniref:methionine--tRNA ligase n=1 Tax=Stylosanthes scabra TaxID=79078 RepID=A0ABU6QH65_9FABA|nr:Methionine--tRNA ligase, chloroplastic/mitochondrial [Stylosanthes scabra]
MASRMNCSVQNTLSLLNPSHLSLRHRASRFSHRPLRFYSAPNPSRGALFCTCSTTSGESFILTTPLYYVNAPPHMGSAYTTIAADAIARFQRLSGKKVIFITGTDEHGEKIAAAAMAQGSTPHDHCNLISQAYKTLWKDLEISYDKFIRTTDSKHEAIVKEFYSRVLANGDIYQADYEGLYCVNCEEYKDEKELLENNCCPVHLKPCDSRKEENYFFALSKYQKSLEETLNKNPNFVQPSFRLNECQYLYVVSGIGIDKDDNGYISALSDEHEQPDLLNAVSSGWPAALHLIGKDILRFHAVYWPAMLMSAGLSLPKMVFGHGFLTKDGMKMGKSLGNTLEPNELVHKFGTDAVRYFFLREVEFGSDGDYSEERFINIVNAHLANTIGNLLNRTLGLLKKNCQSTLVVDSTTAAEGNEFKDNVEKLVDKARMHYENLSLSSACEAVLEIGNVGNYYMDERAPWSLFKQGGTASEAAAKDLVIILETVRIIAIALLPVTPSLSWRIYEQLGYSRDQFDAATWGDTKWGGLKGGQVMAQPKPVFARIENQTEDEDKGAAVGKTVKSKGKKMKQAQQVAGA